jgi:hypothetical protein
MLTQFCRRSLVVGGVALALAAVAPIASASHSWNGYHWARTANPFTVKLGNNVTTQWTQVLNQASSDWNASDVLNTTVVTGLAKGKNCRGTSGRVEVCNGAYGNNGWLGIASISITGGTHITQGTVRLNDTYFNTSTYNSPAWRALVACQEIGHTFGLDHQDENFDNANLGTCMDYTNDPSTNQHPNKHDYDELDIIYSHVDSTNTISQPTADNFADAVDTDNPATWGQLVKASHNGRTAVYERNFGGGRKQVTFVIFAREK